MHFLRFPCVLLLASMSMALMSCTTTSVEDEYAEFEPILKTAEESQQEKAMRMFGEYDPNKTSSFQNQRFAYGGKDANLRSSFDKKDYSVDGHPYFKLRDKGYFSDKKAFQGGTAREGSQASSLQRQDDSWFKRTFSRRESDLGSMEVSRKDYRLPPAEDSFSGRSHYERTHYPVKTIEDTDKDQKISKKNLGSLLNAQ